MQLSKRIKIEKQEAEHPTEELLIHFDDPPGYSPARLIGPLNDFEASRGSLQDIFQDKVSDFEIGGVYSAAFTGESYAILWFALGGIAGGILGAIGEDVWNAVKEACDRIMKRNSARRNVVEIALEFDDLDIVFHYESRDPSRLSDMFGDADSILEELRDILSYKRHLIGNAKTLELRYHSGSKQYTCVLYSYKRCRKMFETRRNKDDS